MKLGGWLGLLRCYVTRRTASCCRQHAQVISAALAVVVVGRVAASGPRWCHAGMRESRMLLIRRLVIRVVGYWEWVQVVTAMRLPALLKTCSEVL